MFCAVSRGHVEVADFLLRNNANINHATPSGSTVMHIAAYYNQQSGCHASGHAWSPQPLRPWRIAALHIIMHLGQRMLPSHRPACMRGQMASRLCMRWLTHAAVESVGPCPLPPCMPLAPRPRATDDHPPCVHACTGASACAAVCSDPSSERCLDRCAALSAGAIEFLISKQPSFLRRENAFGCTPLSLARPGPIKRLLYNAAEELNE